MVAKMTLAANVMFWGILAAMLFLLFGSRKTGGLLYWLLVLPIIFLPLLFLIDYSAWLWWYGHRLNAMGAFTVKPFMPTVFGDGKVAPDAAGIGTDRACGPDPAQATGRTCAGGLNGCCWPAAACCH